MLDLSPRRRLLLDAATTVLAREGSRGFTHRAVDREAGVAEGSCSAYWRTRQALMSAVAAVVSARISHDVATIAERVPENPPHDVSEALVLELFDHWLKEPTVLLARLELTLMSARDSDLAVAMSTTRGNLESMVEAALTRTGSTEAEGDAATDASTLVAAMDGILLNALLLVPTERPTYLSRSVRRAVEGLTRTPEA